MLTPRELRLRYEFESLKALRSPYRLFDFLCADLTALQAQELLYAQASMDVFMKGLAGFLTPEDYEARSAGIPPEKYLIRYTCLGLMVTEQGQVGPTDVHVMEVDFGWSYPAEPPRFLWYTPIWHPNFNPPYICIEGHPFAIELTLSQIIPEVGRMVQYQSYNSKDPLNAQAAQWVNRRAREFPQEFPVDRRDILDARRTVDVNPFPVHAEEAGPQESGPLIDLL
jgi:hypothetical protein